MFGFFNSQISRITTWRDTIARIRTAYRQQHKRELSLFPPRRFTEKIQWRKLFDMNGVFPVVSDKLAVRSFISERAGSDCLIPILWTGSSAQDIPFDQLTPPFVLKSTHASGHYIMVAENDVIDRDEIVATASRWLAQNFGLTQDEPGYAPVPPGLIAERTIRTDSGGRPNEVRLFVFDGKVAVINTVFIEDGQIRNGAFHTPDWTKLDWYFSRRVEREFFPPKRLADMIRIAERAGKDLDQVRIDFYDCGDRIYVGEMTLYAWSGLSPLHPDHADLDFGAKWKIRNPLGRSVWTVLFGRRGITRTVR